MQRELVGLDALAAARLLDQLAGERSALLVRDHPADHVATEDVEDYVQVEVRPLLRPEQLGDVPTPQLVGACGEQLGTRMILVPELVAPLAHLLIRRENPV